MPTQEERLTTLEQDRNTLTEALAAIAQTQADHTLLLVRIAQTQGAHSERFDHVEALLDSHTVLLQQILLRLPPAKE